MRLRDDADNATTRDTIHAQGRSSRALRSAGRRSGNGDARIRSAECIVRPESCWLSAATRHVALTARPSAPVGQRRDSGVLWCSTRPPPKAEPSHKAQFPAPVERAMRLSPFSAHNAFCKVMTTLGRPFPGPAAPGPVAGRRWWSNNRRPPSSSVCGRIDASTEDDMEHTMDL